MINLGRVSEFSSRPRAFQIPSWRERAANQALGWSTYRHNEYANRPAFGYICFNELRNGGGSFGGGTLIKVLSGGLKSLKNKGRPAPHLPVLFYCLDFIFTATVRECCFPPAIVSLFLSLFQPLPPLPPLCSSEGRDETCTCASKIFELSIDNKINSINFSFFLFSFIFFPNRTNVYLQFPSMWSIQSDKLYMVRDVGKF